MPSGACTGALLSVLHDIASRCQDRPPAQGVVSSQAGSWLKKVPGARIGRRLLRGQVVSSQASSWVK